MDPVNVVRFGAFVESTSNGDIYSLNGAEYLVYEDYAEGFGYSVFCRPI